jgi:hypothetical protein
MSWAGIAKEKGNTMTSEAKSKEIKILGHRL